MKDSYVLHKCILAGSGNNSIWNHPEIVASLYDRFYPYWDPTSHMNDMTGIFSDYPSSPLMETLKQQPHMLYFIKEYFLNEDIYDPITIGENKCILMTFFIKINNLFRRLYLVKNKSEFVELFTKIHNDIILFSRETIPNGRVREDGSILREEFWEYSFIFSDIMITLIDHSFNTWLRTKYGILSIIQKHANNRWGPIDEGAILDEIEKMMLS
ncbi:MAG: hypothetical protein ACD_71C00218G0011 [uncultured bacterium (gcode 4)]|uniref:Uncharacterized protein n=1 Tax=uncultured bacterium (gcode 4) TaxID=1234023 RepID=K1Z4M7_9BACT|nr:MAG: hypothetical protein ACD_71C00218G0011 [uncultured bacterium (gcode 4)]